MYKEIIRPILNKFDSETFHDLARESLHLAELTPITLKLLELLADKHSRFEDKCLKTTLGGLELENPLIVGAGWDKAGRAVLGLWHIGFASVEVGSVLEYGQPGNPKPRLFMVTSGVAINWLAFNSPGMDVVAKNLDKYKSTGIPIGISLGLNKDVDHRDAPKAYGTVAKRMYDYAGYFAINVSSPNTPGLRKLQEKERTVDIIKAVNQAMDECGARKPLFVKIAPDLSYEAVDEILEVALNHSVTGIIASNTTVNPDLKGKYGTRWKNSPGGLSGDDEDYRKMTTDMISHIYRQAGDKLDIIGVGGIKDSETALEKIKAGAKALQLVTAIRGEGTAVAGKINRGISAYIEREGVGSIEELVGVNAEK
ncbi:MAG: quinone-dependent dihydroorotate dehydrogenase [Candidatus Dadabacteria bacterium]|nr:quinone-dependent dihydroorotate dehydrogenase [Candidatus Dadabacteria bacterium]